MDKDTLIGLHEFLRDEVLSLRRGEQAMANMKEYLKASQQKVIADYLENILANKISCKFGE